MGEVTWRRLCWGYFYPLWGEDELDFRVWNSISLQEWNNVHGPLLICVGRCGTWHGIKALRLDPKGLHLHGSVFFSLQEKCTWTIEILILGLTRRATQPLKRKVFGVTSISSTTSRNWGRLRPKQTPSTSSGMNRASHLSWYEYIKYIVSKGKKRKK